MADRPKQTMEEVMQENDALRSRIPELKAKRSNLERQHQELSRIQQLQIENAKLEKENADIDGIRAQIEQMKKQKEVLDVQNKKLERQRAESEDIKDGVNILTKEVWKPLAVLRAKFKEFDKSGTGDIDRREFRAMLEKIEQDMKVSRLFSMLDQHSASSVYGNDKPSYGHNTGTVDSTQGWSAGTNNTKQWYQIDCVVPVRIGGVMLQGRYNADQWVLTFKVSHSEDGVSWSKLDRTFDGCHDRDTKEIILFDVSIYARYIRIRPITWHSHISLRADLLWVEGQEHVDEEKTDDSKGPRHSEFDVEEQNKLFNLFDLKGNGKIQSAEFLAVLDREAIAAPKRHPHQIIKQALRNLLHGNVKVKEDFKLENLGKESKGFKFSEGSKGKCCICGVQDGIYGFTTICQHVSCLGCLQFALERIQEDGEFPAYCIGCNQPGGAEPGLDKLISGELLRFWVEEEVIELAFACRMWRAQDRVIQELQFEDTMKTLGMRKCPNCGLVILKNEGCNYFKCKECATEICYETGKVAGKGPGQCGGGHSCHY